MRQPAILYAAHRHMAMHTEYVLFLSSVLLAVPAFSLYHRPCYAMLETNYALMSKQWTTSCKPSFCHFAVLNQSPRTSWIVSTSLQVLRPCMFRRIDYMNNDDNNNDRNNTFAPAACPSLKAKRDAGTPDQSATRLESLANFTRSPRWQREGLGFRT